MIKRLINIFGVWVNPEKIISISYDFDDSKIQLEGAEPIYIQVRFRRRWHGK